MELSPIFKEKTNVMLNFPENVVKNKHDLQEIKIKYYICNRIAAVAQLVEH